MTTTLLTLLIVLIISLILLVLWVHRYRYIASSSLLSSSSLPHSSGSLGQQVQIHRHNLLIVLIISLILLVLWVNRFRYIPSSSSLSSSSHSSRSGSLGQQVIGKDTSSHPTHCLPHLHHLLGETIRRSAIQMHFPHYLLFLSSWFSGSYG